MAKEKVSTHISGTPVIIKTRVVQRCAFCGFVLIDDDTKNQAVPEGMLNDILTFAPMNRIEVHEGNPRGMFVVHTLFADVPTHACYYEACQAK